MGAKLALFVGARLLVLHRDDRPGLLWPGFWDLPGGGREGAESPLDCALRETREEFGLRWNEKWVYRDPDGDGCDRVVLFHRYDLRGILKVKPDGSAEPEPLPEV